MILIGYDGSDDAKAAIAHAGSLSPGATTTILTVWEPFAKMLVRTAALRPIVGARDLDEIDATSKQAAEQCAQEGVALADAAGLKAATAMTVRHDTLGDAILEVADELDADAIVLGSRGLTGVGSLLLGSVSHWVLQHADRTVVVVPAPTVAERRRHRRHADEQTVA